MGRTIIRTQKTENGLIIKIAHYNGEWVAEITGTDPKYKFARTFLDPIEEDWSSSGKTGWSYYKLENGKIYQVNEPYGGRYFVEADGYDWYDIEEQEVMARLREQGTAQEYNVQEENAKLSEKIQEKLTKKLFVVENGKLHLVQPAIEDEIDAEFAEKYGAEYKLNLAKTYILYDTISKKATLFTPSTKIGGTHIRKNVRIVQEPQENATLDEVLGINYEH